MERYRRSLILSLLLLVALAVFARAGRAQAPAVVLNEVLVGNASTNIDPTYTNFSSWLELRNTTGSAINLQGYKVSYLETGTTSPLVYTIPSGVSLPANGRLIIWADEEKKTNHTNFDLDMDGGVLSILAANNNVIDSITLGVQQPDVSIGRSPDGGGSWAYFDQPTPGTANTTPAFAAYNFTATPTFSVQGGLYAGPQSVALSSATVGATIRYTTDGSEPTNSSSLYSGPIPVNATGMIRARAWAAGKMVSPTATQTYLINIPVNLPIISVTTDPDNLFDNQIGIYVKGTNGVAGCRETANWHQRWERPANFEFYETNGTRRLNQEVGLEIHGNCTRNFPQKSFEVKARKDYGDNDMDYAFFSSKPMTSYRRLILRNGGNDNYHAFMRDAAAQNLAIGRMDVDRQAYRPAVVYLNGQYWGLYDLREKMDEDYVENNYGLEEPDFDLLEQNHRVINGGKDRWMQFYNYVTKNNPATPSVYANIQAQLDVRSFIDYIILEMYAGNTDWPGNNTRFWDDHGSQFRWRWMLRDVDYAFGFKPKNTNLDMIQWTLKEGGPTAAIVKNLMKNSSFKNEFGQRFAVHLNTTFTAARVLGIINGMADGIRPEMPAQTARWGRPSNAAEWESKVDELRNFANQRPAIMLGHVRKFMGNPPDSALTINIQGTGKVYVAGAEVPAGYSGPHFRGVPMTLVAVPGQGLLFVHWLETGETNPTITIPFTGNTTRTAVFGSLPPPPNLVINEIHYSPQLPQDEDSNEFIEIVSNHGSVVNLAGYTIPAISYTFPAGATIDPGEYIVVAADAADPSYAGLPASSVFDFVWGSPDAQKLSNGGEAIALINPLAQVADQVIYDDVAPWPLEPDGSGPSLALLDPALDNSAAANWAKSRQNGGTPGALNFPPLPPTPPVAINEIHYNPTGGAAFEFIELVNNGPDPVALDGYTLEGINYTFPAATTLPAGGYLVVAASSANYPGAAQWTGGDLSDAGERVALVDPLAQVVDEVTYGIAAPWAGAPNGTGPSLSLGRVGLDNSAAANWAASQPAGGTPGSVNFPPLPLVINELHYNVLGDDTTVDPLYEFLELVNTGASPANLSGYTLTGIGYTFPAGASIAAGEYIVVAKTATTYGALGVQVFDWADAESLSNGGEPVTLADKFGNVTNSVNYDDVAPWPTAPDGLGPTLSLLDPALDNSAAANWAASTANDGTPGAVNFPPLPPVPPVVINEIHYNPVITPTVGIEFIELYNDGPDPVALEGFTLEGVSFTFPATTLPAGGYLVIAADNTGQPTWLQWTSGNLDDNGETITLKDAFGQVVDSVTYDDEGGWPTASDGGGPSLSLRDPALDNSATANWAASALIGGTPGATNFPALPLVINEIHYNPVITPTVGVEFIELVNTGPTAIYLEGFTLEGISFTFPATTLPAGGYLIIAADATGQPTWLQWTSGDLDDSGETITLKDADGQVVDVVAYDDEAPWRVEPDGGGPSLSLLDPALDNSLAASWVASTLVGGTPSAAN